MEITGPEKTEEGLASGEFTATLTPSTAEASAWSWSFEPVPGAGNNPDVPFASTDQQTTSVSNAHWFALPDDEIEAPPSCSYTLVCEATVDGEQIRATHDWEVWIHPNGGLTNGPTLTGSVDIDSEERPKIGGGTETVWFVNGQSTLARTPAKVSLLPPNTSQFYPKIKAHEDRHVHQWNQGAWSTYFSVDAFYNTVSGFTSNIEGEKGRQFLEMKVGEKLEEFIEAENKRSDDSSAQREADANSVSDPIPPKYRLHPDHQ